ncbi:MAG: CBS domain-containing protein [Kiloniellales bacterium]|nr:CBS domain-containing protein [Kiloniellales bacterium]
MKHREVGQLITRKDLVCLTGGATVREACRLMAEQRVGAVLILEGSTLQGIFTERDALNRVLAAARDPDTTRLFEVMTEKLVTLGPNAAAVDALRLMSEIGFRHLPVVEDDHIYGIISLRDFIGAEFQQA